MTESAGDGFTAYMVEHHKKMEKIMSHYGDIIDADDARMRQVDYDLAVTARPLTNAKWDLVYTDLARWWAERVSKDPSTQVGAVIVDKQNRIRGMGYNGFPKGVHDHEERYADRPTKYSMVVHAEPNAIVSARGDLSGCTIYTSLFPCNECAKLIIQAGIKRVVSPLPVKDGGRWDEAHKLSCVLFHEGGVQKEFVDG